MTKKKLPPEINWPYIARLVLTSRGMDNLEESEFVPQGEITYQFSAKGHELAQVLLAQHLTHPHDCATVYYRSRPFMLASGLSVKEAFAAGFAKTGSPSEGRDVGVVFSMQSLPARASATGTGERNAVKSKDAPLTTDIANASSSAQGGLTVLPSSGNVGAQYTPAAGWAQAIRYRQEVTKEKDWEGAIAVAMGGEGSTAANGFWAALNIVTTRDLPYLFFIEDNSFAISVRSELQTPGANVAANLQCYENLHILEADGTDPEEAAAKIAEAVDYVRGGKPCLLRLDVVRIMGHTFIDDQSYKTEAELEEERQRDPLTQLKEFIPDLDWDALEVEVETEVRAASQSALQNPDPETGAIWPASATQHLFAPLPASTTGFPGPSARTGDIGFALLNPPLSEKGPRINLIEAVKRTLESEMEQNPRVLIFGEDVGVKGGVHGATAHMQEKFGEERVFDTSLSEEGIMGSAVGLSLAGLTPVPEIQFRKYADPATEQINDAGTIRWRTAGKFAAPMVVRIPVGFGKVTGDPWHSVSGEAIYAHTLGWRLAYPSNAADAAGLLRTALRGDDPVIFFEHRALLDTSQARRPWPGDEYILPLGVAGKLSKGDALTIVTWGAMVYPILEAAKGLEGIEILDLRTISPWDKEAVLESVKKTGKCLIVHEDTITGGFAGEIMATIASDAFEWLDAPLQRLATPDCPIPYNIGLMNTVVPSKGIIKEKLEWLLAY